MAEPEMIPFPSVEEQGTDEQGNPIGVDRRLYMQLLAYRGPVPERELSEALENETIEGVLYRDLYDPLGYGLLTMSEDPSFFPGALRDFLQTSPFARMELKPKYGMFGRSYTLGHEKNPAEVLLQRPRERAANPEWPWAIWYPLRREGSFAMLPAEEQRRMLKEHGHLGMAFGRAEYGVDIRLACYGMDTEDNDFLIGLVGSSLHRLSLIVQTMRKTQHTAEYLERLGPFFVGRVAHCTIPSRTTRSRTIPSRTIPEGAPADVQ